MSARKLTDIVQVKLRLRESLRRKLEREAEKRGLSTNAELARRLEESFDREELNEALRSAMWQVLTHEGLTEALKPLAAQIVEKLDASRFERTKEAFREIEARRELETKPERRS
jgi:Arc-like DNA binding domain